MSWRHKRLWLGGPCLPGGLKMIKSYCAHVIILSALTARAAVLRCQAP